MTKNCNTCKTNMSLFQYGFSIVSSSQEGQNGPEKSISHVAAHLPSQEDNVLGESEYSEVTEAVVDLSGPKPPSKKRGKYANYSANYINYKLTFDDDKAVYNQSLHLKFQSVDVHPHSLTLMPNWCHL